MNVYVMTDMEGITGVVNTQQVEKGSPSYEEARLLLAGDVNAAIAGAFDAGAKRVVVNDAHGGGFNLPLAKMDARAEYEQPFTGLNVLPAITSDFDAFMIVGQHAMSGTPNAFLEHTQSSESWHRYWIEGVEHGELGQYSFYASAYGVPLVFCSGDLAAAQEAKAFAPGVEAVSVKEAIGRLRCRSLSPEEAHKRIREGVVSALKRRASLKPRRLDYPVSVKLEFNRCSSADNFERKPRYRRLDGFTIEWTAENERELLPY